METFAPISYDEFSMYRNVQLSGNGKIIEEIIRLSRANIRKNTDLYTAMDTIKSHLKGKYGEEWFDKSAEAIEHIIENTYCNHERMSQMDICGMLW